MSPYYQNLPPLQGEGRGGDGARNSIMSPYSIQKAIWGSSI
jgi:hypothetical protein